MLIKLADYMKPVRALSKPHKGVVVDNEDPKKLGRVKCTIEGLMEAPKDDLPWISNPSDYDSMDVPEVGAELTIEFPFDDVYAPIFTGYLHSEKTHNSDFDTDYPNTVGFSKGGLVGTHNKETDESKIVHPSGTEISVLPSGKLELTLADGMTLVIGGDYEITADSIKFTATGNIELSTDGDAKLIGKGSTTVGDSGGITKVDGSTVLLAGGGMPMALLGGQVVGQGLGNLTLPVMVMCNIIEGSSKAMAPK